MEDARNVKRKSKEYGKIKFLTDRILEYKGVEVGIFEEEPKDTTPARIEMDARNGKDFIYMLDTVPKKLYKPVLEHEVYEIQHGKDKHKEADKHAEKVAKDLGILEEFKKFREYWMKRRKRLEQEGL